MKRMTRPLAALSVLAALSIGVAGCTAADVAPDTAPTTPAASVQPTPSPSENDEEHEDEDETTAVDPSAPPAGTDAAIAWAEGEVENIEMYDRLLAENDDASLIRVLTNLRNASADSHLPAFEAAAANGGTLTAEQMSAFMPGRQSR